MVTCKFTADLGGLRGAVEKTSSLNEFNFAEKGECRSVGVSLRNGMQKYGGSEMGSSCERRCVLSG